jgi:3'-5' exoribonuclease
MGRIEPVLNEGDRIDAVFAVRARELRTSRTGEPYLWLELTDRTGSIEALRFCPGPADDLVPAGSVARVAGIVTAWRGRRRLKIDRLEPASAWDPSSLVPASVVDVDETLARFDRLMDRVRDAGLAALLRSVFGEPGVMVALASHPQSADGARAHIGGLIEHCVAVAEASRAMARAHALAEPDLVVAAALLHDIGRLDEISVDSGVRITQRGRLLGHGPLGAQRIAEAAERCGLDQTTADRLAHVALHHHDGPDAAATIEGVIVASADAADAAACAFADATAAAARAGEPWSGTGALTSEAGSSFLKVG